MRLAIMQPYFVPYAGYFRLFAATDMFVIYDCVQFPRRGWVHRNQFLTSSAQPDWLTLPLQKAKQTTLIQDLQFAHNTLPNDLQSASAAMENRLKCFPLLHFTNFEGKNWQNFYPLLMNLTQPVIDYLHQLLQALCQYLKLNFTVVRSSTLLIDPHLKGQQRILEICRFLKATTYVNASNGRDLYCKNEFKKQGINLQFLTDYQGPMLSILHRILTESQKDITHEIRSQSSAC